MGEVAGGRAPGKVGRGRWRRQGAVEEAGGGGGGRGRWRREEASYPPPGPHPGMPAEPARSALITFTSLRVYIVPIV